MKARWLVALFYTACQSSRAPSVNATESPPPFAAPARQDPPAAAIAPAATVGPFPPAGRPAKHVDPRSEEILRLALESPQFDTRLIAIDALADAHFPPHVEWLAHALGDPEHDVRLATVEALGHFETPRARQLLASVRDDAQEDLDIRALAASAVLLVP